MKTKNLLMTLGVAALTTLTFNAIAGDAFLSPRAAGNEINRVSGLNNDPNLVRMDVYAVTTPRATGNQTAKAEGTNTQVSPAASCAANMIGSPRQIQACVEHPGSMPGCDVTVAAVK